MEITSVNSFLDYYARVRERTNRVVQVIPPEHMDWTYKPGKFTIADLLRHIACIERNLYAEVAQGRPSRYKGCDKELADGYQEVLRFFEELHQQSMEIFSSLQDRDLSRRCITPAGSEMALWKWLRALVEHEIHHRGQLYIYLSLLEVKTPPIFGLTSEEVQATYRKPD